MRSRVYETVERPPHVCPAVAAGLLLSAARAGDADRQRRAPGSSGAAAQHSAANAGRCHVGS